LDDDADASMTIYRKPMQITKLSFLNNYTNEEAVLISWWMVIYSHADRYRLEHVCLWLFAMLTLFVPAVLISFVSIFVYKLGMVHIVWAFVL
jgi:hypothetical protein